MHIILDLLSFSRLHIFTVVFGICFLGYLNCCFTFYIYRYAYLWWETHDWSLAAGKFFLLFNVNNTSSFFLRYSTGIRVMLTSALGTGLVKESNIVVLLWKLCSEFLKSLKSVGFNLKLAPLRHRLAFSLVLVCYPRACVQHFTCLLVFLDLLKFDGSIIVSLCPGISVP